MGIGSFCLPTLCVDKGGPITTATLAVRTGDQVTVAIPSAHGPLLAAFVNAFPAAAPRDLGGGATQWTMPSKTTSLLSTLDDSEQPTERVEFTVKLASGTYVVSVAMLLEDGDVQYGVVLEVK